MSNFDDLFTITCAKCAQSSPVMQWTEAPISGPLPEQTYQCPSCNYAFQRGPRRNYPGYGPTIELKQCAAVL